MKRVIVCGNCSFEDYKSVKNTLDSLLKNESVMIVSGHARGADRLGERWAEGNEIPCAVFPACWKKLGRKAGPIRNSKMIAFAREGTPMVIAFWDQVSSGTGDTVKKAHAAGIETVIIPHETKRQLPPLFDET